MKILITGGLGLIGHNVVSKLQNDHEVEIIDNGTNYGVVPTDELQYLLGERLRKINPGVKIHSVDIANKIKIAEIFNNFRPEIVLHLASFPRQKVVNANPQWGSRVMSEGMLNLLEHATASGARRFVYISSSMVYGNFTDDVTEDAVCSPQGQYGIMKLAGEWLVKDYHRRTGMEYVILRPSAVYGPLDVEDRVISKFMITAMRGGTLKVNGASESLDFTYVDDAADGVASAATLESAKNRTFNITKSHSWSLLQAAELTVKIVGKGSIEVKNKDPDFPSRGSLNINEARKYLGFDPKVDIEEGFQRYHEWLTNSVYWSQKTIS